MKPGIKKGDIRRSENPGFGKSLAKEIETPLKEYRAALKMNLSYPACGLPDLQAIESVLGLSLEMLSSEYSRGRRI